MLRTTAAVLLCLAIGAPAAFGATFTVTTTADSGAGSLRQAITDANALPGADQIHFNIGGGGPQTITVLSALPVITDTVVIDGTTQPGFGGTPIVTLDGNGLDADALRLESPAPSTIRGLVIIDFVFAIRIAGAGGTVAGNYLGVDASGTGAAGNSFGIWVQDNTGPAIIGGASPGDGNVISGNFHGIALMGRSDGAPSLGNVVQGNIIGLTASGATDLGNDSAGINIEGGDDNLIGGTLAGQGNVISGNGEGIRIIINVVTNDPGAGNIVQGNLIGTNLSGTAAVPNTVHGISLGGARDTTIGGAVAGARNVISGNGFSGIGMGTTCGPFPPCRLLQNTVISGNFIGTDITGTSDLGNNLAGISFTGSTNTIIGGPGAGAGNVISGNGEQGILARSSFVDPPIPNTGAVISFNRIGTNAAGTAAIPNGGDGLELNQLRDSTLEGNLISGNEGHGISLSPRGLTLSDPTLPASGNTISGNRIGVAGAVLAAIPNGGHGIFIASGLPSTVTGNVIGGTGAGDGNTIWFNTGDGINSADGDANRFLGNSIDRNGGLGIDLNEDGPMMNDPGDPDTGANNRQNYPILTGAVVTGGSTFVAGNFNSTPARTFRLEFFGSPTADPTGFGEGRTFLGAVNVTTDATGDAEIAATVAAVAPGTVITSTATDLTALDTSEFSNAVPAGAAATLNIADTSVLEGDSGTATATFNVTLTAPSAVDVTFDFATSNGTATAPGDYTATSGSGTIPAGSTSTTITVPVLGDGAGEADETFTVTISNVSGAVAGDLQAEGTIANDDFAANAAGIPTLSEWALLLTALLLAFLGILKMRY
jgi:Right handed beta helix region/Calx-beta domain/IPTL-CTERM motif